MDPSGYWEPKRVFSIFGFKRPKEFKRLLLSAFESIDKPDPEIRRLALRVATTRLVLALLRYCVAELALMGQSYGEDEEALLPQLQKNVTSFLESENALRTRMWVMAVEPQLPLHLPVPVELFSLSSATASW